MKKYLSYIYFGLMIFFITNPVFADCVKCGEDTMAVPSAIPKFTSSLVTLAQLIVPIVLIVTGMVRYIKVVVSGEDKTAKEVNQSFIKSIIAAVLVFISIAIVKFAFSLVSKSDSELGDITACVSCFIDGNCRATACPSREMGVCSIIKNEDECTKQEGICTWKNGKCRLVENSQVKPKFCYRKTCGTNVSYVFTDNLTNEDNCTMELVDFNIDSESNCNSQRDSQLSACYLVRITQNGNEISKSYKWYKKSLASNITDPSSGTTTIFTLDSSATLPNTCEAKNNALNDSEACYYIYYPQYDQFNYKWMRKQSSTIAAIYYETNLTKTKCEEKTKNRSQSCFEYKGVTASIPPDAVNGRFVGSERALTGSNYNKAKTALCCQIGFDCPKEETSTSNTNTRPNTNTTPSVTPTPLPSSSMKVGDYVYYNQALQGTYGAVPFCGGKKTINSSGCGAASFAMVASNLVSESYNPRVVANWLCSNGHSGGALSQSWYLKDSFLSKFGLQSKKLFGRVGDNATASQKQSIVDEVNKGHMVILYIPHHYVTVARGSGNKVILLDPGHRGYNGEYTIDQLFNLTKRYKGRCCGWNGAYSFWKR